MIDDPVWSKWWTLWTTQFLTPRGNPPHSAVYESEFRASMERRLTTEEFGEAALLVFDTARWFPTPGEVVDGVRERIRERGTEAWGAVLEILGRPPPENGSRSSARWTNVLGGRSTR